MTPRVLAIDGALARSPYPERADRAASAPDQWARALLQRLRRLLAPPVRAEVQALARVVARQGPAWQSLDDAALRRRLAVDARRAVHGLRRAALHAALAGVAEAARRTLGLAPYPSQLAGAAVLLRGELAEMATGEGKTLTAGLAAALAALAGVPVHVVTVNDYLATRDAESVAPLLTWLGLTVGTVINGMQPDERRRAYACDVAYCTNKELVFDYLRDRVAAGGSATAAQVGVRALYGAQHQAPVLRGLHLAIVDEADSIMVDEARTPLILAEKAGAIDNLQALPRALALAASLAGSEHFDLDPARRALHLTPAGRQRLATACADDGPPWRAAHEREHLVTQALRALHLFHRDQHYLVDASQQLQIIDEYTGRVLPGRTWEQGLHQMIEAKEGLAPSEQTRTLARITYQRFFPRYLRLAGMTGTARELAQELAAVYGLRVRAVPTHRPSARRHQGARLCRDEAHKWQVVADEVAACRQRGQPVLVGTRSVAASERLSAVLQARGIDHQVLNARQDADEAAVVAGAGRLGAVTVATNMAGRGTDIALGPGVAALGGLCVLLTEYHESPRIDRQLFGRCARQGEPGSCMAIVARDDSLFIDHGGAPARLLAATPSGVLGSAFLASSRRQAQARAERLHARTRRDTLRRDIELDRITGLAGAPL